MEVNCMAPLCTELCLRNPQRWPLITQPSTPPTHQQLTTSTPTLPPSLRISLVFVFCFFPFRCSLSFSFLFLYPFPFFACPSLLLSFPFSFSYQFPFLVVFPSWFPFACIFLSVSWIIHNLHFPCTSQSILLSSPQHSLSFIILPCLCFLFLLIPSP